MQVLNSIQSMWVWVIGIIVVLFVLKVIRSIIGKVMSLAFTIIGLIRLYGMIKGKW